MKTSERLELSFFLLLVIMVIGAFINVHYCLEARLLLLRLPDDTPSSIINVMSIVVVGIIEWGIILLIGLILIVTIMYYFGEILPNKHWPAFKDWLDKFE